MITLRAMAYSLIATAFLAPSSGSADTWGTLAIVSSTMGSEAQRLCVGDGSVAGFGCPTYAPSLTTAGDVSVSGNLSANTFIGDGSGLTGISVATDRITSGTTSIVANSATSSISFTVAGTQAMTISNSGNVGIGTATPTSKLEINGGVRGQNFTITGNGQIAGLNAGLSIWSSSNATVFYDNTQTVNYMTVKSGKVGIGIVTPTSTLHVSGTVTITSNTEVAGTVSATEVRVSSSGAACTTAVQGTMRYNATRRRFEICLP